jgi:hypothetical protein
MLSKPVQQVISTTRGNAADGSMKFKRPKYTRDMPPPDKSFSDVIEEIDNLSCCCA